MERPAQGLRLALGDRAPYFSLRGTDGKLYSLAEFIEAKVLVIVFTCNHCPYAQAYEERLCRMAERFKPDGVQFVWICSNDALGYPQDDFESMVEKSRTLGFPFPYLQDESQITAQAYDAACTPEAYVFDHERRLQYHGRVDDNHMNPEQVKRHELAEAIQALLEGRKPEILLTPVLGCAIKWKLGNHA